MAELTPLREILAGMPPETRLSLPGSPTSPPTRGRTRGIPLGRENDSFENFDATPEMSAALAQCRKVARGEARCALLQGSFGNGKTHLAIAALREWGSLETGYFWKVPDWLAMVKRRSFDEGEPLGNVLNPARANTLIVFDDLGAENQTDWAAEQLFRVLDARYDSRAPTIITSNKPLGQLDPRIVSRYRAGLVVCAGEDRRDA